MKTLIVLAAVCLALLLVVPQTEAQCYRIRLVRYYLVNIGGNWYRICKVYYIIRCNGKRDEVEDGQVNDSARVQKMRKEPGKSKLEPFPNMFSSYDKDGNKSITYHEFQTTLSDVKDKTDLRKMFDSIDKNGDKSITCRDEFLKANLDFSKKPVC